MPKDYMLPSSNIKKDLALPSVEQNASGKSPKELLALYDMAIQQISNAIYCKAIDNTNISPADGLEVLIRGHRLGHYL